jgi:flagellar biosynthesis protein FlhB
MAGSGGSDRSEKPTPRRLQKAREKGQVPRSREVPAALILLGGLLVLSYSAQAMVGTLGIEMRDLLRMRTPAELSVDFLNNLARQVAGRIVIVLAPVMGGAFLISILSNLIQGGGFTMSGHALGLHFEKLSPVNGLSRVFSKSGTVQLVKSVFLLIVVSIISYQVISKHLTLFPRMILMDVRQLLYWTGSISYEVLLRVAIFMVILAAFDYAFEKYRFLEHLKMTKQEVKEEMKEMEGDPLTKGRIRRIQREMARKRMMADVPKADVVITNPTHYAVALVYKVDSMDAPKVVAKGVGFLALRIKELARQHDIPTVENKPLAQTLYKTVEVGEVIPATLYKTVAEILAYIYKARAAWRR